ncbi:MAG: hypothetical protein HDT16_02410 [Oscillibacter sp.]|nr:hypothetical protein [Oscillibacter sp.]
MSDQTITLITILLFIFVLSAFIWPFALGIHLELEERKKRNEPPDYDERQKLARQRAGNHALYVLLGFLALWTIVDQIGWFSWTGSVMDMSLCAMLLAWGVWTSECILNDAFVTWKNKQLGASGSAATTVTIMVLWINNFRSMGIVDSWMPSIFACGNMAVLLTVVLYKTRRDKKAAQEEDAP